MQYDENAEKYGYEGEMTPIECDKLQAYKGDVYIPVYGSIADADVYLKKDADTAIAELKDENAQLKQKLMPCLNGDCILTCEVVEKYGKENAELKAKLEDVQASAYAESVDAGMRERRLRRALWLARAWGASNQYQMFCFSSHIGDLMNVNGFTQRFKGCSNMRNAEEWQQIWKRVERKCIKKAEEYK